MTEWNQFRSLFPSSCSANLFYSPLFVPQRRVRLPTMPYYGRGGAGNIQAAAQEKERIASDPEAQLSTANQPLPNPPSITEDDQAYKRSGRGGAGNYFASSDDAKLPASQAEIDAASKPLSPREAPPKYGRGGAGNINFASDGKANRDELVRNEEQKMQHKVAKAVESFVDDGLQVPEKARLPSS